MATKKSAAKKTAEITTVICLAEIVAAGANGLFTPRRRAWPACRSWLG